MLFSAKLSQDFLRDLFAEEFYAVGYFFPVVPAGRTRIRTQRSVDHDIPMLEKALAAFKPVGEKYGACGLDKKRFIERYGQWRAALNDRAACGLRDPAKPTPSGIGSPTAPRD